MELALFNANENPEIIRINRAVWIKTIDGIRTIYVNWAIFAQYPVTDEVSERYAIVNMARSKVAFQKELAQAFGYHFNTVGRYIQTMIKMAWRDLSRKLQVPKVRLLPRK